MLKHTPGPWSVDSQHHDKKHFRPGVECRSEKLAIIFPSEYPDDYEGIWGRTKEEGMANACLIAEAPAMYEALKALLHPDGLSSANIRTNLANAREILTRLESE